MLARLKSVIFPPPNHSAVVVVGTFGDFILGVHVVPEDGTIEIFGTTTTPSPFRHYGAKEQSRQQIATVTVKDRHEFMREIEQRIRGLWNESFCLNPETQQQKDNTGITKLVQNVLQPAAFSAIDAQEGCEGSPDATKCTHPVYIIYINRATPGKIIPSNLTSFWF
ncbi:hypothetical protein LOZ61_002944 [Ophidiomyces ophidiicola]|nr:hypothetical protein LOZ61_002944 [Ophidiomyces ophidiicola]KAI1920736.1 hypothetical protein LOZ64_001784 [Ophidiomyces ophidiicola]KAI1928589.1 hypothetical protein LOZ60_002310 [Ophidiomyces ophidiicola]KAI2008808.1 hypothetical protein LOZ49_004125 [Ophidiomyces ophidiicola]KAI2019947.1 hypothetical protein LOZ46_003114 [Ophidiomyces ophidiicola]